MCKFILLFLIVLCFSGCASIIHGGDKVVSVRSHPEAKFIIKTPNGDAVYKGETPERVYLKRGRGYFQASDYTIEFQKDGYEDKVLPIKQSLDGWYTAGNIVIGGLIGWIIVDPITGAMWDIKDVNAYLDPTTKAKKEPNPNVVIKKIIADNSAPVINPNLEIYGINLNLSKDEILSQYKIKDQSKYSCIIDSQLPTVQELGILFSYNQVSLIIVYLNESSEANLKHLKSNLESKYAFNLKPTENKQAEIYAGIATTKGKIMKITLKREPFADDYITSIAFKILNN